MNCDHFSSFHVHSLPARAPCCFFLHVQSAVVLFALVRGQYRVRHPVNPNRQVFCASDREGEHICGITADAIVLRSLFAHGTWEKERVSKMTEKVSDFKSRKSTTATYYGIRAPAIIEFNTPKQRR